MPDPVNCKITIRNNRARAAEPLSPFTLLVSTKEEVELGLRKAFFKWEQEHQQGESVLEDGCTIAIEIEAGPRP
jgi:hypothetical protein